MNFEFNEKEQAFLTQIESIMTDFEPIAGKSVTEPLAAILEKLAATDFLKLGLDKVEGMGIPVILAAAQERFAAAYPSLYLTVEMSARVFGRILFYHADAAQKAKYLAPLLAGKLVGALALSESSMNVDNEPLSTMATADGGGYLVSGAKSYVVNAGVADVIAVACRVDDKVGFALVDKNAAGLTIGNPYATLGFEGALIAGLTLENVKVEKSAFLGPYDAKTALSAVRMFENQVLTGAAVGAMKAAFEAAKKHAKEHKSGGKPVIAFQEVAFKLAEMLTSLQTSELFAMRSAWVAETTPKEAEDIILCAKVFCAESAEKVASDALQILGGAGFTLPNAAERAYRNAKYTAIAGTSTEICRVKIGDSELGYR